MIPKILHYCWFGSSSLPGSVQHARSTWQAVMPDYELVEWNENNTPLDECEYARWCAKNKQWAFLSDYVKADVLNRHGGIFLDADVLTHRRLDSFLSNRAFSGFERSRLPFTAVWGSEAGHAWPATALQYMDKLDTDRIALETNTSWMTRLLAESFSIDPMVDTYQEGAEGVVIYPSETLCLGSHVGWATHLFAGSWLPEGERGQFGININDLREASLRLEMFAPGLMVRAARLLTFSDSGEAADATRGVRGGWTSDRLPEVVGLRKATQTFVEVGAYAGRMYWRGMMAAARQRMRAAVRTKPAS